MPGFNPDVNKHPSVLNSDLEVKFLHKGRQKFKGVSLAQLISAIRYAQVTKHALVTMAGWSHHTYAGFKNLWKTPCITCLIISFSLGAPRKPVMETLCNLHSVLCLCPFHLKMKSHSKLVQILFVTSMSFAAVGVPKHSRLQMSCASSTQLGAPLTEKQKFSC